MRRLLLTMLCIALAACGGGGSTSAPLPTPPPAVDPWEAVTAAIVAAQPQFPGGLTVELMTPAGVVYSRSFGAFSNANFVPVASSSKWVSATVLLRLVEQGRLSLDTQTKSLLTDRAGQPWAGNIGEIRLRHLLSFTSGISGDVLASEDSSITLDEAVKRIHDSQAAGAGVPGSTFYYGSTHLRIAARMAEIATGLTWRQLFDEQLRVPLGWNTASSYGGNANPNPAGSLFCTGLEYTRFLMMQLRQGLDGNARLLSAASISAQRADAFGPATTISFSPYTQAARVYHYGFGNWLETANGQAPGPANPVNRWSSSGLFGWAPWVAADSSYAGVVMTLQTGANSLQPSEVLKNTLDPLVRTALASNPPVIRAVP